MVNIFHCASLCIDLTVKTHHRLAWKKKSPLLRKVLTQCSQYATVNLYCAYCCFPARLENKVLVVVKKGKVKQ